jgi:lysine 2,3-aminomutase
VSGPTAYTYRRRTLVEPDWRRFPGWRDVTESDWRSAAWQRQNSVRSVRELRSVLDGLVADACYADLERDRTEHATMSLLVTPQMLNTIVPFPSSSGPGSLTDAFYADPVRRYMLPLDSDRRRDWPSHPWAMRDSLHEKDMWVTEGLIHRYPNKVLAELVASCPQYCGHCTRMDLVGQSTPSVRKVRFQNGTRDRLTAIVGYLATHPEVRDIVISGGDVANVPWHRLEDFLVRLIELGSIRDIRLASKAVVGLPQHWLADAVRAGLTRLTKFARERDVQIAVHTHANAAQSVTPTVAAASHALLEAGVRDVRNQGVLMHGVNDSAAQLLDLCFAILDSAATMPYYFYLCDMIPFSEHWRVALADGQRLQDEIMGYLPGFATPRIVCDVPYLGKRWVHQAREYDRTTGISRWGSADGHRYADPIHTLPEPGRQWWRRVTLTTATSGE